MENASESQKEDFNKEEIDPVNLMFIEEQIETLSQSQSLEGECQLTVNPIVEKKVDSDDAENIITEFSPEDANVRFLIFIMIMIINIKHINLLHREEWQRNFHISKVQLSTGEMGLGSKILTT